MIAHRGLKLFENKIMFFPYAAKRYRVQGIECDIHENSQGRMVVTHDRVDRDKLCTDYLSDFPRFSRTRVVLDIKSGNSNAHRMARETVNDIIPMLEEHDWELCSFNKNCVKHLLDIRECPLDFKVGYINNGFLGYHGDIDIDFVSLYYKNITPKTIRYYRKRGIRVYAWTVPTDEEEQRLKDMGVDEVIRDI